MALEDDAVLNISTGYFWRAPVGTAAPTDPLAPASPWVNMGHTSLDQIMSITSEGGDTTTLGTLQSKTLRTSTAARTENFNFNLAQFDEASLKLFFGSNATIQTSGHVAAGMLGVPDAPTPTSCAFLVVFVDGDAHMEFYAPKTEVIRAEDMNLADTTSLALLPIKVTPLNYLGASDKYYVSPIEVV